MSAPQVEKSYELLALRTEKSGHHPLPFEKSPLKKRPLNIEERVLPSFNRTLHTAYTHAKRAIPRGEGRRRRPPRFTEVGREMDRYGLSSVDSFIVECGFSALNRLRAAQGKPPLECAELYQGVPRKLVLEAVAALRGKLDHRDPTRKEITREVNRRHYESVSHGQIVEILHEIQRENLLKKPLNFSTERTTGVYPEDIVRAHQELVSENNGLNPSRRELKRRIRVNTHGGKISDAHLTVMLTELRHEKKDLPLRRGFEFPRETAKELFTTLRKKFGEAPNPGELRAALDERYPILKGKINIGMARLAMLRVQRDAPKRERVRWKLSTRLSSVHVSDIETAHGAALSDLVHAGQRRDPSYHEVYDKLSPEIRSELTLDRFRDRFGLMNEERSRRRLPHLRIGTEKSTIPDEVAEAHKSFQLKSNRNPELDELTALVNTRRADRMQGNGTGALPSLSREGVEQALYRYNQRFGRRSKHKRLYVRQPPKRGVYHSDEVIAYDEIVREKKELPTIAELRRRVTQGREGEGKKLSLGGLQTNLNQLRKLGFRLDLRAQNGTGREPEGPKLPEDWQTRLEANIKLMKRCIEEGEPKFRARSEAVDFVPDIALPARVKAYFKPFRGNATGNVRLLLFRHEVESDSHDGSEGRRQVSYSPKPEGTALDELLSHSSAPSYAQLLKLRDVLCAREKRSYGLAALREVVLARVRERDGSENFLFSSKDLDTLFTALGQEVIEAFNLSERFVREFMGQLRALLNRPKEAGEIGGGVRHDLEMAIQHWELKGRPPAEFPKQAHFLDALGEVLRVTAHGVQRLTKV